LVKFGTYVFPRVLQLSLAYPQQQQQIPLPGRSIAYRKRIGGLGVRITLAGEIRPASQQSRDQMAALADGTARILDLEDSDLTVLESCLRFQTGPVWTDNTAESQSPGGTPFTLLGASTDYAYFGHREKFNRLQFDLQTLGDYDLAIWEYSKGNGAWGTLDLDTLLDDFLGSSLDTKKWNVLSGSATVSGGVMTVNDASMIDSVQSFGPYVRTVARLTPKQTNAEAIYYPIWIDANNYIRLDFYSNGNLYCGLNRNGSFIQNQVGSYSANLMADYVVTWSASKVRMYRDGVKIWEGDNSGPSMQALPGRIRFHTPQTADKFDVDYVKTCMNENTMNFMQDGSVILTPPSDWRLDTVNSIANKFWIRVNAASVRTAATVNQIQLNLVYLCLLLDPEFPETASNYDAIPYRCTLLQQENP